jgi:hypothetical protein
LFKRASITTSQAASSWGYMVPSISLTGTLTVKSCRLDFFEPGAVEMLMISNVLPYPAFDLWQLATTEVWRRNCAVGTVSPASWSRTSTSVRMKSPFTLDKFLLVERGRDLDRPVLDVGSPGRSDLHHACTYKGPCTGYLLFPIVVIRQ